MIGGGGGKNDLFGSGSSSKVKIYGIDSKSKVKFSDVAGLGEAKLEI
jgi:hypothetical protein